MNDEKLISLLEQAEMVSMAFMTTLPLTAGEIDCPTSEIVEQCIAGLLNDEEVQTLLPHLVECSSCRRGLRQWRSLYAANHDEGMVFLEHLREILGSKPASAGHALQRVSKYISRLVRSQPDKADSTKVLALGVIDSTGASVGEMLRISTTVGPWVDSHHRIVLGIESWEPADGEFEVIFQICDAGLTIEVGSATLIEGVTELSWDLRDLDVKPGYLSLESLKIKVLRSEGGGRYSQPPWTASSSQLELGIRGSITSSGFKNGEKLDGNLTTSSYKKDDLRSAAKGKAKQKKRPGKDDDKNCL